MTINSTRLRLIDLHPKTKSGVWQIYGEDPNYDMSGPHVKPLLETVEGEYGHVVEYALRLNGFFDGDYGGDVVFLNELNKIKKIFSPGEMKIKELEELIANLERQICDLDRQKVEARLELQELRNICSADQFELSC